MSSHDPDGGVAPAIAAKTVFSIAVLAVSSIGLAACGGGGGDAPPPPANTPPTAQAIALTTGEDVTVSGTFLGQDADGNPLTYSVVAAPANGTLGPVAGATFTYTPKRDYFGTDSFTYAVSDGRASASATVTIEVEAVNDPPTITLVSPATSIPARAQGTLDYAVTDVDDSSVVVSVAQVSGPSITSLTASASTTSFVAPDASRVEAIVLQVRADDGSGGVATRDVAIKVFPVSASGATRTIFGGQAETGIDWVIVAEGYTSAELAKFHDDAYAVAANVLDRAPIQVYKPAWNVHAIETVSNESGLDVATENILRDTALGAYFCITDRTVCADGAKVFAAILAERPAYDIALVLVNSPRYGGSGGVYAVATTHASATEIVLHELGHSFAGLADEYPDPAIAPIYLPGYREDLYPNVTTLTDLQQIKWRHWFINPQEVPTTPGQLGIGLFEGAFYHDTGFYRPANESFMRLSAGVWSTVHAEAWATAVYRLGSPARSFSPTAATINVARGAPAVFSVSPLLPAPAQSIRWTLNQVEVGTRDSTTYSCCDDALANGSHTLTVQLIDVTGTIRHHTSDNLSRSWTVNYQ